MTATQRTLIHRIDRDRSTLHRAALSRLVRADRQRADLGDSIERLAMMSYLTGMYRAVKDATRAIGRDARAAHLMLSREDEKKERDRILWLILFLGLSDAAVAGIQARARQVSGNAGRELEAARTKVAANDANRNGSRGGRATVRGAQGQARQPSAARANTGTGNTSRLYEPGVARVRESSVASRLDAPMERFGEVGISDGVDVFGRFGQANLKLPEATLDTWAEAVTYSEYEAGRFNAGFSFPAISEALWGYHWSSILDTRTTAGCRALNGWVAPISDTWMKALAPPRHWHCRSVLIPVYQSSALKRPEPYRPASLTDATLQRYLAQKEEFARRVA